MFLWFCLVAALTRIVGYLFFNMILYQGELEHPDSYFYHLLGSRLADGVEQLGVAEIFLEKAGYIWLTGGMYSLFGKNQRLMELLSILVGALVAGIGYQVGEHLVSRRAARFTGYILALDPMLIYWSTQMLKDMLVVFLVLSVLYFLLSHPVRGWWRIAQLAGLLLALASLRLEIAVILGGCALWVVLRSAKVGSMGKVFMALCVGFGAVATGSAWWDTFGPEGSRVVSIRIEGDAALSFINNVRVSSNVESHVQFFEGSLPKGPFESYWDLAGFVIMSPIYLLMSPFVWQARTLREMLFSVYMIWWYALVAVGLSGLQRAAADWRRRLVVALACGLGIPLVILITSTASFIRWRMPIGVVVSLYAGQGLVAWLEATRRAKWVRAWT